MQPFIVAFSLSILGYTLLPLTAAAQATSPTPDSSTTAATIYLLSDSLATTFWAGGILGSAGSCTGALNLLLVDSNSIAPARILLAKLFFT